MPLQRGEVQGYDFDRMIVEFTMFNQGKVVPCAISTAAMDDLEGRRDVRPDQRVDQFVRLREVIEERVSRKFFAGPGQPTRGVAIQRFHWMIITFPSSRIIEAFRSGDRFSSAD